jgi:DNA-directed RNA polymerase
METLTQSELNEDMTTLGTGRYRAKVESAKSREAELQTPYGQRLMRAGLPALNQAITDWQKGLAKVDNKARFQLDSQDLDPKVLSYISIKVLLDCITQKKSLSSIAIFLGARVEDELRCQFLVANNEAKGKGIILGAVRRKGTAAKVRHIRSSMKHETEKGLMDAWEPWSHRDKLNLGLQMTELVRVSTNLVEYTYILEKRRKRPTRYVNATADTLQWIEEFNENREFIEPFWLPTVELPVSWTNIWDGGYDREHTYLPKVPFIKTNNMDYLRSIEGSLPEPMEATNLIQQTPWTINPVVLKVMEWCWENNVIVDGLPAREQEELPPIPIDFKENKESNTLWRRMAAKVYNNRLSNTSRRLLVSKILYVAKKLKGKRFFYPSHVDFRGRLYNIPAFLSIQGPDISRGLLQFHRGEKIRDEKDARWLAIQGANTYGNDKITLEKRIQWAEDYAETAIAIHESPTTNLQWMDADEPFQFLAWCNEWGQYKKTGKLVSYLPVNLDGTNNGLQILSMLMRDEYGAKATNVLAEDEPQDIYRIVSDLVLEKLEADKENNHPYAERWIQFGIDRKLAKRPTMVWPYGGTFYSCRDYVDEWYQDTLRKTRCANPFTEDERYKVTGYLSKLTWSSINEVLEKPKDCMNWLQSCAKALAEHGEPVSWTSPSGFPVLQSYKKTTAQNVRTNINGSGTYIKWYKDSDDISPRRQKQGISPNYVHSMDAACLAKTVVECNNLGIYDFAMIHDSYGTHAANCDTLSRILREQYYAVFKVDQLETLLKDLKERYPHIEFPDTPEYGNADLSEVLRSQYFFS